MSAPRSSGSFFDGLIIAAGVALAATIAWRLLDPHSHTCDACGRRWSHTGALNTGVPETHACPSCGRTQWWRDDVPPALRAAHEEAERRAAAQGIMEAA